MSLIQAISNIALKPVAALGNLLTSGLEKITGKKYGRTTSEEASKTTFGKVLGTAIAGTTLALGAAVLGGGSIAAGAAKAAKAIVPKTTKGKIIAAGAASIAVPAAIANPVLLEKGVEAVGKTPEALVNVGTNIGEFSASPSLEKAKEIFTENPVIVGGLLGAGALVAGKGLAGTAATIMNTQATKENTMIMNSPQVVSQGTGQVLKENLVATNEGVPITPAVTTITTGKKPYRRRKKETSPQIRNSVRVNIINHNVGASNRKFIKVGALN